MIGAGGYTYNVTTHPHQVNLLQYQRAVGPEYNRNSNSFYVDIGHNTQAVSVTQNYNDNALAHNGIGYTYQINNNFPRH